MRDRPELPESFGLVFDAFVFLAPSRPAGFSLGAIPLSEILAYAEFHPLGMPLADFVFTVRALDLHILKSDREKSNGSKQNTERHD